MIDQVLTQLHGIVMLQSDFREFTVKCLKVRIAAKFNEMTLEEKADSDIMSHSRAYNYFVLVL